jgi:putative transposase
VNVNSKNRTPSEYVFYGLYFYFSSLSLRRTPYISSSCFIKRNHVSIWNWIQKYNPQKTSSKKKKVSEYSCIQKDETVIKIGSELIWFWVVIELESKEILGMNISK